MALSAQKSLPVQRVRPAQSWNGLELRVAWQHRDIIAALVRRELKLRYRQTVAGVLWVLGQPLLTTLVTSILLVRLAGQTQAGLPYPIFVYVALVPWAYISHALTKGAGCFIEYAGMVTGVFMPRLLIPLAVILAALVDFGVAFLFLPVLMLFYRVALSWQIVTLPFFIGVMMVAVFGVALWLASLNAEYRDIAFALPFLLQLGLFVTPIFYSTNLVPLPWQYVYALNPFVGVVEGVRWALVNPPEPVSPVIYLVSALAALLVLASGLYVFQRREPNMADVI